LPGIGEAAGAKDRGPGMTSGGERPAEGGVKTRFEPRGTSRKVRWAVRKAVSHFRDRKAQVYSVGPDNPARGHVLLSYDPAFAVLSARNRDSIPNSHTNYWESMTMVDNLVEMGYRVDVIDHKEHTFRPSLEYSLLIDTRLNLERLAPMIGPACIKVMHIDSAHVLFNNAAEFRRLLDLQQRRGVTMRPRRYQEVNRAIETADCATTTGNAFTMGTFAYAKKPIYRLPISSAIRCEWPDEKDWDASRRRFLWFSSGGLVHKGLDLALEAFAGMPDYHLTVCAPVEDEEDFARAYRKELFETPNIETVGWIDVESPRFRDITGKSVALLFTSCSEGGGASAVTCMHAGLIPIVSRESSVDVEDFGFLLKSCSVPDIREAIRTVADLPPAELAARARGAWESARANHTRERVLEVHRKVMNEIVTTYSSEAGVVRPSRPSGME
jgi:glycosyltransferase involved in cell wall biosynthesis